MALATMSPACSAGHQEAGPDFGLASGEQGDGAGDGQGAVAVVCDDLDEVIGLAGQIAANAGATRGRYPVVLAHGFFGFDRVGPFEYWNGAERALRQNGFAAYVTAVEPIASSEVTRGPELARQIACIARRSGATAVNIVAHSQGGLDARFAASQFSRHVASVTSISTPHRGTPIADAALGLLPDVSHDLLDALADGLGQLVGAPVGDADFQAALEQLTVQNSGSFNDAHGNHPDVAYFSWAGRSVGSVLSWDYNHAECAGAVRGNPAVRDVIDPELFVTYELLRLLAGPNDGLVTVDSGRWGTFMGCIPADHMDEIGLFQLTDTDLISGFNHREFLLDIAGDLASRGF